MKTINHLIADLSSSDARSVVYYLSRYLKQVAQFNDYEKDIFQDDGVSEPTELVRSRTLTVIEFIEAAEGTSAAEFSDSIYGKWALHAEDVESALQPEASAKEMERAAEFINAISLPRAKVKEPRE